MLAKATDLESDGSHTTMMFGSFTNLSSEVMQPDGSVQQNLVSRPAWVVIVYDVMLTNSGPPDKPHIKQNSDVVHVYDASTGVYLEGSDGPASSATCPIGTNEKPDSCGADQK
jgi:hypothetical protein